MYHKQKDIILTPVTYIAVINPYNILLAIPTSILHFCSRDINSFTSLGSQHTDTAEILTSLMHLTNYTKQELQEQLIPPE